LKLLKILVALLLVLIGLPILAYVSGLVYFVPEYQNVVVTRFGEVQYAVLPAFREDRAVEDDVQPVIDFSFEDIQEKYDQGMVRRGAGLYFKLPFVDQAHYFDARVLVWEGVEHEISTKDLRSLIIEPNARWRIVDPISFYESLGDQAQALTQLASEINASVEDLISETLLIEVVRDEDLGLDEEVEELLEAVDEAPEEIDEVAVEEIRYGRGELLHRIEQDKAEHLLEEYGIQLVDVLFTRVNYPENVRENVFDRMKAERNRVARQYESEGEEIIIEVEGEISERKDELISDGRRQAEEIRGRAERQAISIWAEAYQRDPEFFRFMRSLEAYEEGFDAGTAFLLSDGNRLLQLMQDPEGATPDF